MSNYAQSGNRYTMILLRRPQRDGTDLYERVPFDLVRFNVDENPSATPVIMPLGQPGEHGAASDDRKIFEKIWYVDVVPWGPSAKGGVEFKRPVE